MHGKSIFAAVAVFVCAGLPGAAIAQSDGSAGVVTTVNGDATLIRPAATVAPVSLRMRDEIFVRDRIHTRERSLVRVLLGGKALITVRELSELTVIEEAGRVTADSYREFARPGSDWDSYLLRIADVADRVQRTRVIVAVEEDRILGTVTLELTGRTEGSNRNHRENQPLAPGQAHVRMLGVAPEARGRGIGKLLMEACIDESRKAGKTLLTLNTTERMKVAQAMYESMGFTRAEDEVFPDGFVLMAYELPLDADADGAADRPGDRT